MKKIIGIVLFIFVSFVSFGQKFDVFTLNDEGLCIITKTISTNNSMEKNQMLAKSYLKTMASSDVDIKENTGDDVVATVKFNTKVTYNPFAGNFTEWLRYDIKFSFSGSDVTYTVYDIVVSNVYTGFGATENKATMEEKIMEYNDAKEKLKGKLSGKEKKEYKDIVEDWEDSLENHEEEFTKRVTDAIAKKFK